MFLNMSNSIINNNVSPTMHSVYHTNRMHHCSKAHDTPTAPNGAYHYVQRQSELNLYLT